MSQNVSPAATPAVETRLVYAHGLAAIVTLLISVAFGILASIELLVPDLAGNPAWLSWGRLRYDHTQGIMLGWLGNAFFAFLYHAVPLLTGRPVTSARLGQWIFGLWNFAVVAPGWVLVLAGFSQPLEWAEFPMVVDVFVVIALALAIIQFLPPFFRRGLEDLYVSSWYVIGGLVFTLLAYPMGNFVPELVPGARGAAFSGLWIHDAVGLFVTPLLDNRACHFALRSHPSLATLRPPAHDPAQQHQRPSIPHKRRQWIDEYLNCCLRGAIPVSKKDIQVGQPKSRDRNDARRLVAKVLIEDASRIDKALVLLALPDLQNGFDARSSRVGLPDIAIKL